MSGGILERAHHRRRGAVLRRLALALLLVLPATWACAGRAHSLEPMVSGGERIFHLEWNVVDRRGRPVVSGSLTNDSMYTARAVQLLVEALDANGTVVAQEVTRVAAQMTPTTRSYFEVPAGASRSSAYRVRVFAFDLVDSCGD